MEEGTDLENRAVFRYGRCSYHTRDGWGQVRDCFGLKRASLLGSSRYKLLFWEVGARVRIVLAPVSHLTSSPTSQSSGGADGNLLQV